VLREVFQFVSKHHGASAAAGLTEPIFHGAVESIWSASVSVSKVFSCTQVSTALLIIFYLLEWFAKALGKYVSWQICVR